MSETMTSEERAAVAVHNATQNRMCLNLSGNGQICVACSEVADQIDAAVEVERQRGIESLAAANARAEKAEARSNKLAVFLDEVYVLNRSLIRARDAADKALAAARRECEGLRNDIAAWMLDRADQYETDDPIWVGIADLAKGVVRGDAQEAAKHGELSADLYSRLGVALAAPAAGEITQADLDAGDAAVAEGYGRDRGDVE